MRLYNPSSLSFWISSWIHCSLLVIMSLDILDIKQLRAVIYFGFFCLRPPPKVNMRENASFAVGSSTLGALSVAAQLAMYLSFNHFSRPSLARDTSWGSFSAS